MPERPEADRVRHEKLAARISSKTLLGLPGTCAMDSETSLLRGSCLSATFFRNVLSGHRVSGMVSASQILMA
jgi:hypothetical protein